MCAAIRSYERWSGKERTAATRKTNEAVKKGLIPPASDFSCRMCGRGKDEVYRMEYHHENYDTPTENLTPLCNGCHIKFHKQYIRDELAKEKKQTDGAV